MSILILLINLISSFFVPASIGLWTFIDQAINLRNPSANITTSNTPFVLALPGDSTNVISFLGFKDSYVLLENRGDLTVSSFTWSTMIFQNGIAQGPLFSWWSNWPDCRNRSAHVKVTSDQKIKFGVCAGSAMSWMAATDTVMVRNQWHEVAVSYDGETGYAQAFVDGVLH